MSILQFERPSCNSVEDVWRYQVRRYTTSLKPWGYANACPNVPLNNFLITAMRFPHNHQGPTSGNNHIYLYQDGTWCGNGWYAPGAQYDIQQIAGQS